MMSFMTKPKHTIQNINLKEYKAYESDFLVIQIFADLIVSFYYHGK